MNATITRETATDAAETERIMRAEFNRLSGYVGRKVRVSGFAGSRTETILVVDMIGHPRSWAVVREREDGSISVLSPEQVAWLYSGFSLSFI